MKIIGLVGCGSWGKNILRDLIQLDCQVYVADINSGERSRAAASGAIEVFSSHDEFPECVKP